MGGVPLRLPRTGIVATAKVSGSPSTSLPLRVTVVEGTIEIARADDVLHIDRPAYSQADATLALFVLNPAGDAAIRASVRLGRMSTGSAEVLGGLEPGDRVVVSDMSRWSTFDRLEID